MMDRADPRGFSYVLDPVRRQRQWKLDAALAHVGNLHKQLCEREAARQALQEECASQALSISHAWIVRPDPVAQSHLLGYLLTLHRRSAEAQRELATLTEMLRHVREKCAAQQQALDVLDEDRADTLKAFTNDQVRRFGAQADQDWIARESQGCTRENGE